MDAHAQNFIETRAPQHSWSFEREIILMIPLLRAFSRSLCRDRQTAEDLTQETLVKAWRSRARFERGTNLKAWLFVILRNEFYSHCRRTRREGICDTDLTAHLEAPANAQHWAMELSDTILALHKLPAGQREALTLVGAAGFSYKEAAQICGVPIGTTKSRVARARVAIAVMLENGPASGHGTPANVN